MGQGTKLIVWSLQSIWHHLFFENDLDRLVNIIKRQNHSIAIELLIELPIEQGSIGNSIANSIDILWFCIFLPFTDVARSFRK